MDTNYFSLADWRKDNSLKVCDREGYEVKLFEFNYGAPFIRGTSSKDGQVREYDYKGRCTTKVKGQEINPNDIWFKDNVVVMSKIHTQEQLGICVYCSGIFEKLTKDHIIPRSKLTIEQRKSTRFCMDNIVGVCAACNNLKNSDDLIVFLAKGSSNVRKFVDKPK